MMEINRLFKAILRKWWLIAVLSIFGGCIAGYVSIFLTAPVYEAETTVYAMNRSGDLNYQDMMVSRLLVQDYSAIISSQKVTSLAMDELKGMNLNEAALRNMISINLKKDSSVMGIRAVSSDSETAAAIANAVSRAFIDQIRVMTNRDVVGILDEAKVPRFPIPGNSSKNILIGILAGVMVAFAIIYIIELFDTTIRYSEDVENNLKLRVIGMIPEHSIR